jgi:hypothetical protein
MSKNIKLVDNNAVVANGAKILTAVVTEKRDSAVILKYEFGGKECTGVMHVSQFPSLEFAERDALFAAVQVGDSIDSLEASVVPPDAKQGRKFTSVHLSGRSLLQKEREQQRLAAKQERDNREAAFNAAIAKVNGTVVTAVMAKLAYSKDPKSKQFDGHFFGAFLECDVDGVKLSGLLHISRMAGGDRSKRLVDGVDGAKTVQVLASVTEKGLSFSEEGVKDALAAADAVKFLTEVQTALADGKEISFLAKLTENRLETGGGVTASYRGAQVEVSNDDLALDPKLTKGTGRQLKLVPLRVENGVIVAKRFRK